MHAWVCTYRCTWPNKLVRYSYELYSLCGLDACEYGGPNDSGSFILNEISSPAEIEPNLEKLSTILSFLSSIKTWKYLRVEIFYYIANNYGQFHRSLTQDGWLRKCLIINDGRRNTFAGLFILVDSGTVGYTVVNITRILVCGNQSPLKINELRLRAFARWQPWCHIRRICFYGYPVQPGEGQPCNVNSSYLLDGVPPPPPRIQNPLPYSLDGSLDAIVYVVFAFMGTLSSPARISRAMLIPATFWKGGIYPYRIPNPPERHPQHTQK